jgi:hypothetical protein
MQDGEMRLLGSIAQQWQFLPDVVIRKSIQGHGQAQSVLKIEPQSKSFENSERIRRRRILA